MKLSDQLRISRHADGAVLLDISGGQVYSANGVGAQILALIAEGLAEDEIAARISREFQQPINVIQADVGLFLMDLRSRQLIHG